MSFKKALGIIGILIGAFLRNITCFLEMHVLLRLEPKCATPDFPGEKARGRDSVGFRARPQNCGYTANYGQ
jgi:hypothetical protein